MWNEDRPNVIVDAVKLKRVCLLRWSGLLATRHAPPIYTTKGIKPVSVQISDQVSVLTFDILVQYFIT